MAKNLRRKGQGETQRPTCPNCEKDMKRSYIRVWNPTLKKQTPLETGYECSKCKIKIWD